MEHAVEAGAMWLEHSSKNCARRVCCICIVWLWFVDTTANIHNTSTLHIGMFATADYQSNHHFGIILEPLLHLHSIFLQKESMDRNNRFLGEIVSELPSFLPLRPRHCEAKSMYWSLPVASHSFSFNASVGFWILAAGAVVAGGWSARVDSGSGWQWCVEISCVDIHENYWNLVFWSSLHMFTQ